MKSWLSSVPQILVAVVALVTMVRALREWKKHKRAMAKIEARTKAEMAQSRADHARYMATLNGVAAQPYNQKIVVKHQTYKPKKSKAKKPPHFKMNRKAKWDV